jgi:hypothetical protein
LLEKERLFNKENAKISRPVVLRTLAWLDKQATMAAMEAELGSAVLSDEEFLRIERSLTKNLTITAEADEETVDIDDDASWSASPEFLSLVGVNAVTYKKPSDAPAAASPVAGGPTSTRKDDTSRYTNLEEDEDDEHRLIGNTGCDADE